MRVLLVSVLDCLSMCNAYVPFITDLWWISLQQSANIILVLFNMFLDQSLHMQYSWIRVLHVGIDCMQMNQRPRHFYNLSSMMVESVAQSLEAERSSLCIYYENFFI